MARGSLRVVTELEVKRRLDGDEVGAVSVLLDAATHHDGHHALGEHQWLDLVHGGRAGFAGIVATVPDHPHPIGYAQVSRSDTKGDDWSLELVIGPTTARTSPSHPTWWPRPWRWSGTRVAAG